MSSPFYIKKFIGVSIFYVEKLIERESLKIKTNALNCMFLSLKAIEKYVSKLHNIAFNAINHFFRELYANTSSQVFLLYPKTFKSIPFGV